MGGGSLNLNFRNTFAKHSVGHGGSFTTEVSDSKQLRTPKVELGLFPYIY